MIQIKASGLSLGYEGRIIVSGIDFTVCRGDYLSIVGENGSGKSTLMKTLLGLKAPEGGVIVFENGMKRNEIGYLPQQSEHQKDFPASVKEIVLSGCLNRRGIRPFYSKEEKLRAYEAMEKLGITSLMKRCYRELSGGQQQRVLLARALCAASSLIALDEPTAGLDPAITLEMYELIKKLNDEGITVITVSHDIEATLKYSSKVLHIGNNAPLFFGSTEDYMSSDIGLAFRTRR